MNEKAIRIILAEEKSISGVVRKPGYTLLEGICPEKVAADDLSKAIQLGQVRIKIVKIKNRERPK